MRERGRISEPKGWHSGQGERRRLDTNVVFLRSKLAKRKRERKGIKGFMWGHVGGGTRTMLLPKQARIVYFWNGWLYIFCMHPCALLHWSPLQMPISDLSLGPLYLPPRRKIGYFWKLIQHHNRNKNLQQQPDYHHYKSLKSIQNFPLVGPSLDPGEV